MLIGDFIYIFKNIIIFGNDDYFLSVSLFYWIKTWYDIDILSKNKASQKTITKDS